MLDKVVFSYLGATILIRERYTQFNKLNLMSNTIRKDKNGREYKESLKKKDGHFRCRCEYCLGKKNVVEKIAEKEMKEEVRGIEMGENIDFDIPKQDEILEQIFGEKE